MSTSVRIASSSAEVYDWKWSKDSTGQMVAKLKGGKRLTFNDYSLNGLNRSNNGKKFFIRVQTVDEKIDSKRSNLLSASEFISKSCEEFYNAAKKYLYADFSQAHPEFDEKKVKVEITSSNLSKVTEAPFAYEMTFFVSDKYSKFYQFKEKQKIPLRLTEMLDLKNSYYRIEIRINTFLARFLPLEDLIVIKCYVNVPTLIYMGVQEESIPNQISRKEVEEERQNDAIQKEVQSLLEMTKKRKRVD